MNNTELAALLRRGAAAIETPGDLTEEERQHVAEDLAAAAEALCPEEGKFQGDATYAVDIPDPRDPDAEWVNVDYFPSKTSAIEFIKEKYGGDDEGNICLLTQMMNDEEDPDPDEVIDVKLTEKGMKSTE